MILITSEIRRAQCLVNNDTRKGYSNSLLWSFFVVFFHPIIPLAPPKFLPFQGDSYAETSPKSYPFIPRKFSPARGILRKKDVQIPPPKISLESPLNGSRNGDNLSIKSLYFARITLIFPGFLPRAIPLQGQLAGRMQGEMSGNVCCALKGWTLGSS